MPEVIAIGLKNFTNTSILYVYILLSKIRKYQILHLYKRIANYFVFNSFTYFALFVSEACYAINRTVIYILFISLLFSRLDYLIFHFKIIPCALNLIKNICGIMNAN